MIGSVMSPYSRHGHWLGQDRAPDVWQEPTILCGGPDRCAACWRESLDMPPVDRPTIPDLTLIETIPGGMP